jgi:hypothetical protein
LEGAKRRHGEKSSGGFSHEIEQANRGQATLIPGVGQTKQEKQGRARPARTQIDRRPANPWQKESLVARTELQRQTCTGTEPGTRGSSRDARTDRRWRQRTQDFGALGLDRGAWRLSGTEQRRRKQRRTEEFGAGKDQTEEKIGERSGRRPWLAAATKRDQGTSSGRGPTVRAGT